MTETLWEYISTALHGTSPEIMANHYGQQGWEMVSVDGHGRAWFKRRLPKPTKPTGPATWRD